MPTQKEYIPWTPREEDSLGDWLQEHAHLKWAQKTQYYPKPRTVDGLRSKLRAMRLGGRRHSRIRTQHRQRRRTSPQRPRARDRNSRAARHPSMRGVGLSIRTRSPVGIAPFRPRHFYPPTPIAAMIRIGQSIIQLPMRLLT